MASLYMGMALKTAFAGLAPLVLISATQVPPPPASETPADTTDTPELTAADLPHAAPLVQEFLVDKSQRMTVPVRINGSEPFPFVVDTGSERTVISSDLGELLALASGPQLRLATVSGPAVVGSYQVGKLTMSSITVKNLEAPALKRKNLGAYGLLGIDSLENHKVVIDMVKGEMHVLPSKKRRGFRSTDRNTIVVTARRRGGRLVLTNAKMGNLRVDIVIDTGAQSSMGNSALRRRLRRSQRRMDYIPVKLTSVTGAKMMGDFTQVKEVVIGGLTITDLPVTFTKDYAFRALNLHRRPAMLLGMDAMKLFDSVEIDFANKRVVFQLQKRSRLHSPSRLAWKESRTTAMSLSSPVISSP
ncbi:MAG: aspartyl protease family protein [Sphingorhabdus sp.]